MDQIYTDKRSKCMLLYGSTTETIETRFFLYTKILLGEWMGSDNGKMSVMSTISGKDDFNIPVLNFYEGG